ncbi:hypothetical protein ES703_122709 [subsurface metagenome]
MIANAVDHYRADAFGKVGEAIADREDDAVVERIALGRAVEAHGQHRALLLDLQQLSLTRSWRGDGVSHGVIASV